MKNVLLLFCILVLNGCTLSANQEQVELKPQSKKQMVVYSATSKELITQGEKYFRFRCGGCHEMSAEAGSNFGPHLEGIIGRKVAAVEGYDYSKALKEADFVWTEEVMDDWLAKPESLLPGMCITFKGVPDEEVRKAMIAFMKAAGQ